MALNNLVDNFRTIVSSSTDVKEFHYGNFSDINTLRNTPFPLAVLIADDGSHNKRDNQSTYGVRLLIIDTYNKDKKDLKTQDEIFADLERFGLSVWFGAVTAPDYIYDKSNISIDFFKKAFNGLYSICDLQADITLSSCMTPLTVLCDPVTINDSASTLLSSTPSGGTYVVTDSNVSNSDDTYSVNVLAQQSLELPDVEHTDSDLSKVILPALTPFVATPTVGQSGIAYNPPVQSGQFTSFITGDEGDNASNAVYNYTPPAFPIHYARLDFTVGTELFATLVTNNEFGHKFRLTGLTGGYWDKGALDYKDVNGVSTSLALAFPSDYIIDQYTGIGWLAIQQGNPTLEKLAAAIILATAATDAGFSDWRVPSRPEIMSIIRVADSDSTGSTRMAYDPFQDLNAAAGVTQNREHWTCTNVSNSSTTYFRVNASAVITATNATTFSRGFYICRSHHI